MLIVDSRFGKIVSSFAIFLIAGSSMPLGFATFAAGRDKKAPVEIAKPKPNSSRPLTAKEMASMSGRLEQCPYVAGSNKWARVYRGVDLDTGNFTTSATDLSFEGGYGVPVNVTRSYSANNADEGPFGVGWALSADVRSTAGGVLKSPGSSVKSVPLNLREAPSLEDDPNVASTPVEVVTATDASGKEETVQKDVDGVLSTPPWDKNVIDSQYETYVDPNGKVWSMLVSNTVTTPEGTVYTYERKGKYIGGGTRPYNNGTATPEPANVLKITSVTDRHGNVTEYNYSGGTDLVQFTKANGTTEEQKLLSVSMPNGHVIDFLWGNGQDAPVDRIRRVSDNQLARSVLYGYDTAGYLATVTSPGGKTTTYGYERAWTGSGWNSTGLFLGTITDPRGLSTHVRYVLDQALVSPYNVLVPAIRCYKVAQPNNIETHFFFLSFGPNAPTDSLLYGQVMNPFAVKEVVNNQGNITFLWQAQMEPELPGTFPGPGGPSGSYLTCDTGAGDSMSYGAWKWYSRYTQDLLVSHTFVLANYLPATYGYRFPGTAAQGYLGSTATTTYTSYNFMGKPLSTRTYECKNTGSYPWTVQKDTTTSYAYWGKNKYYQQKAVKDSAGRVTFTDYYDNQAADGYKGQPYRVYNRAFTTFLTTEDPPTYVVPPNTPTENAWRYTVRPQYVNNYSVTFAYDAKGRTTDVWKLQGDGTPFSYVQTHTDYGADTDGSWGQASLVTEDVGGAERKTKTQDYDDAGRPTVVITGYGSNEAKQFQTNYCDDDGLIDSIYRTDNGSQLIAQYQYYAMNDGNLAARGQLAGVIDGLSGVSQSIVYTATGGGMGQPQSVTEQNGTESYSVSYTYDNAGSRSTATYATPDGTTRWGYCDYTTVGSMVGPRRVFHTMVKLDSAYERTSEEFHYQYDAMGRLKQAAFAQTPYSGQSGYSSTYPATSRARAVYDYDGGGRVLGVWHWWDTLQSGSYHSHAILANSCQYNSVKGLKTASHFWATNPSNEHTYSLQRTEEFAYDENRDYLTGAAYNDGLPNATQTWTYDAAGNRSDSVCDNLNRASSVGGVACTNDLQGNRLTKGAVTYTWDAVNRMTSAVDSGQYIASSFAYRADGMRVTKSVTGGGPGNATRYRYDGQMGMEDRYFADAGSWTELKVTRYGLGARGIDYIEQVRTLDNWGGQPGTPTTTVVFPVYDAHGNMVATLARAGNNTYSIGNQRSFDAWGSVRQGAVTGDPTGRHCADIGHKQDDESGLIYMRARYYEPTSGRFIGQDPARNGLNWFAYCSNNPVSRADRDGKLDHCEGEEDIEDSWEAYDLFFAAVLVATSSLDIENAWAAFMEVYANGYLANGEAIADQFMDSIGYVLKPLKHIGDIMEDGALITEKFKILFMAYELRLMWYINDIDNF